MIGRWYASLAAFDLDITYESYVSGKSQLVADPLSRLFRQVRNGTYSDDTNPALKQPKEGGPEKILSAFAHVLGIETPTHFTSSCKSSMFESPSVIRALPGSISLPPHIQTVVDSLTNGASAKNLPRHVWASHQKNDERLGPIYEYLSTTTSSSKIFSGALKARAQSYRLINGILHYRSIREIGTYNLNEGWVISVPHSLVAKVIHECHGDNMHGHGGETKTLLAIRQRYHFRRMRKVVHQYLAQCVKCKRAKSQVLTYATPLTWFPYFPLPHSER